MRCPRILETTGSRWSAVYAHVHSPSWSQTQQPSRFFSARRARYSWRCWGNRRSLHQRLGRRSLSAANAPSPSFQSHPRLLLPRRCLPCGGIGGRAGTRASRRNRLQMAFHQRPRLRQAADIALFARSLTQHLPAAVPLMAGNSTRASYSRRAGRFHRPQACWTAHHRASFRPAMCCPRLRGKESGTIPRRGCHQSMWG